MIISKRERYIVIGTAAAIGLLVLNSFVYQPYSDQLMQIQNAHDKAVADMADAASVISTRNKLQKIWADMQANGLKTDQSQADSELQHALLDWALQAGVLPQVLKSDLPRKEGAFQVVGYHVTATGNMRSIAQFVWDLETAKIPIRISDLRITPQREGTDDLSVQLGVSTLSASATALAPKAQVGLSIWRGTGS